MTDQQQARDDGEDTGPPQEEENVDRPAVGRKDPTSLGQQEEDGYLQRRTTERPYSGPDI